MSEQFLEVAVSDPRRLRALRDTFLLDTPAEEAFDRLTRLAMRLVDAPVALITLVDEKRQFFKSCIGLPQPWASERETPLSHSFCQYVVATNQPLLIRDARQHELLAENGAVADLNVIAYLGVPLITSEGINLGSFCVIDHQPRDWTEDDLAILNDLSHSVLSEIELRTEIDEKNQVETELTLLLEISRLLGSSLEFPNLLQKVAERLVPQIADWALLHLDDFSDEKIDVGIAHRRGADSVSQIVHWGRELQQLDASHQVKQRLLQSSEAYMGSSDEVDALLRALEPEIRLAIYEIGIETFIRVPIFYQNEKVGMILLAYGHSGRRYKTRNLLLLQEMAQMVGMAAQNYRFYKQAQQALVRRDEFIQLAAHEVKNPITAVRLGVDVLDQLFNEQPQQTEISQLYKEIKSEIYRLEKLVHRMFDVTLVDVGQLTVTLQPVDLVSVVQETVQKMAKVVPNHAFRIETPREAVLVLGDEMRLQQALHNLLRNAVKYTQKDKSDITVSLVVRIDTAVLSVRDQGIGIAKEQLPHLFDRFYRVDTSGKLARQGLGIGLYLVSEIVRRHRGYVDVASIPGEGSTFLLFLPLHQPATLA